MIVASHIVAGGVLGELVENPAVAFGVGVISHFLLDLTPHFDSTDGGKWTARQIVFTVSDFILAAVLMLIMIGGWPDLTFFSSGLFFGALGGFVPDLVDNVPFWGKAVLKTKIGKAYHRFHEGLHLIKPGAIVGFATQIAVIIFFLILHSAIIK